MTSGKKQRITMKISKEKYDIAESFIFLAGSFLFVAGSAIAIARSLQTYRDVRKQKN